MNSYLIVCVIYGTDIQLNISYSNFLGYADDYQLLHHDENKLNEIYETTKQI